MRLVDSHCHLDFPDYKGDLEKVLSDASSIGVERIIVPGTDIKSSKAAVELAGKYPQIFAACGIHPHEADKVLEDTISEIKSLSKSSKKVIAIGEIGLDFYKGYSKKENQKKLFESCLEIAFDLDKPVILHNRSADEEFLKILKMYQTTGVVHCFSGSIELLSEILEMGYYISFAGNITFPKAKDLRDLARVVPVERLLLETDGPYLSPVPLRGKRNEPQNIKYLLELYAEMYELSNEDIARITTHNANQLFSLGLEEKAKLAYPIRNSLYLNITNQCTNRCTFCTRDRSDYVKGHKLRLDKEPSSKEVIEEMGDISKYDQIVFCGFGEPTIRLDVIKEIASYVRSKNKPVRLVTNGEGDLINGRSIACELKGSIDIVSVSLNAPDADTYDKYCKSEFGKDAFQAIVSFIKACSKEGIKAEVTCLDFLNEEDASRCKRIVEEAGAVFRQRYLNVVG